MYDYFAYWMNKASVGCMLVGVFQTSHIFGALIGAVACYFIGMLIKIWSRK